MNEPIIQLCPMCQTGADTLRLDPQSPMCPYLGFHSGNECRFFKSIIRCNDSEKGENR